MNSFIAQIARLISSGEQAVPTVEGVALNLMERAGADAGRNPQLAQELRSAACAYLRVVR